MLPPQSCGNVGGAEVDVSCGNCTLFINPILHQICGRLTPRDGDSVEIIFFCFCCESCYWWGCCNLAGTVPYGPGLCMWGYME